MLRSHLAGLLLTFLLFPLASAVAQPVVDGDLSDAAYQSLATKQNANAGFGPNIDVQEIVYYADNAAGVLYVGVEGRLDTGNDNGIGLWLGFSELDGADAGMPLGGSPGGHYMGGGSYTADFEVAYMLALNPGGGSSNVFVDAVGLVGARQAQYLGGPGQDGTSVTNPGGDLFTAGTVTHAFDNSGGAATGYEIAIPYDQLGITSASELSAFAFVVSSSGFFSDVTVPGDVTGGNLGFDPTFDTLAGGPYHGTAALLQAPTVDGDLDDDAYTLLATDDGGPASQFGDQYLSALYAYDDEDDLYLGVGGKLLTNNRILVFIDSETGGFNTADFGRDGAPAGGIANFNSGTTFDAGFAPDYVLVLGGPFGGNYFANFYTLSDTGGPDVFLGGTNGDAAGALAVTVPASPDDDAEGFEVRIPKSLLDWEPATNGVQFFAALISDGGFLSNQFITPAGAGDGNYGDGAVDFGAATPDPVTYLAASVVPDVPTVLAPTDGATDVALDGVLLDWSDAANAASYDLQLATDDDFTTLLLDENVTASERLVGGLAPATTYYWRVRSRAGMQASAYAEASFTTRDALDAPDLLAPLDGATEVATTTTLAWSAIPGATVYQVQLATDDDFDDLIVDDDAVTATTRTVGPLDNLTTYHWRVRAGDASGFGAWSDDASFTTVATMVGDFTFDGVLDEPGWMLLGTNAGAPDPGFGPTHRINALYAADDADDLFVGIAGSVNSGTPSNRILVFLDTRSGGFNTADFGRDGAPAGGIANFNSGTTFDAGFAPDYVLVLGGPFSGNYFANLYTLSESGGPDTYLGGAPASGLGGEGTVGASPTAMEDDLLEGFEVRIPKDLLVIEDGPGGVGISLFAAYISDTGFLSNQFITPAGGSEDNYGDGAIDFGTRAPDPLFFRAPLATDVPGTTAAVSPTEGERVASRAPGPFRWTAAPRAASYEVELYAGGPDGTRVGLVTTRQTVTPMGKLAPYATYAWRVRGVNNLGAGPWSDFATFRTEADIPRFDPLPAPELLAPQDGATGLTSSVRLEWSDTGASAYRYEVATDPSFDISTLVAGAVVDGTSAIVTGLAEGTYYWHVRVAAGPRSSAYTAPRSFTVGGTTGESPIVFDGQFDESDWGAPLATNAGGPDPGFGANQRVNALYAFGDAQYLYLGVAGQVTSDDVASNRILVFLDTEDGGYNTANFGRSGTLAGGIVNFNSETTFDPGFAPDYVLAIGNDGAAYFFDLYTLSGSANTDSGGPNLFIGSTTGTDGADPEGVGADPTSDGAVVTQGYEVRIPKALLGIEDGPIQAFVVYTSDTGFLSNQFITPAGPDDGNYGDGAVDFGQAAPDPVTIPEDRLEGMKGSVATSSEGADRPRTFVVHGNYPNPFNPTTTLVFDLPQPAVVHVEVLDVAGRRVLEVPARPFQAGTGRLTLDARALPSGLYLYRVRAEGATALYQQTGRMLLVK